MRAARWSRRDEAAASHLPYIYHHLHHVSLQHTWTRALREARDFHTGLTPSQLHSPHLHSLTGIRESFDDIYLDLSKQSGKCRLAESGIGWKTSSATWTLDKTDIISAQWSRAAKGYEVKLIARTAGVVQLDGFRQEVRRGYNDYAEV